MLRVTVFLLILCAIVCAQVSPPVVWLIGTPPGGTGGSCTVPSLFYANVTTGQAWSCPSGTLIWTLFGTGGGGGTPAGATGDVQINGGSGAFGTSGCNSTAGSQLITCANGFVGGSTVLIAGNTSATPSSASNNSLFFSSISNIAAYTKSGDSVIDATMVVPAASATSGNFMTWIDSSGISHTQTLSAINGQTSTYQAVAADFAAYKTITIASGTFTVTLVASGSQPASGQYIHVINYGSGVVTVARSGQNINGGTGSLSLAAASATAPTSASIYSDGTNYFASTAGGSGGGGGGTRTIQLPMGGMNGGGYGAFPSWLWQNNGTGMAASVSATAFVYTSMTNSGTPTMSTNIWIPDDYSSSLAIQLFALDATGAGGSVRFDYGLTCYGSNVSLSSSMTNTANTGSQAFSGFGNTLVISSVSLPTSGCSAGQYAVLQVARNNTIGSNMGGAVGILTAKLTYTSAY